MALLHKPGTQVAWFEVLTDPPSNAEARNEAVQNEELEGVQRGTEIPRLAEHLAG